MKILEISRVGGVCWQDGRAGHELTSSYKNTKDTPYPKTKKKPQDSNHNKIKSHTPQVGDPQKGKSLYHRICP